MPVLGRPLLRLPHPFATQLRALVERTETDGASAFIDVFRVIDGSRAHLAVLVPVVLRAVALRLSLGDADAILEHRHLEHSGFALGRGLSQQLQHTPLQGRIADGVLCEDPGRVRAVGADHRAAGPADALDDGEKPRSVAPVHLLHARMIAVEEGALIRQLAADAVVGLGHGQ